MKRPPKNPHGAAEWAYAIFWVGAMILALPFRRYQKPENLAKWLKRATVLLVPSAKARVCPEIEAHYAEAVQVHLSRSLSESDAQAAALAELGDARAAGRRLRQKHVTIFDTMGLDDDLTWDRKSIRYFNNVVLLLYASFIWYMHLSHQLGYTLLPDWLLTGLVAFMGVVGFPVNIYSHRLASRPAIPAMLRQYLVLRFLRSLGGLIIFLLLAWVYWLALADVTSDVPDVHRLMLIGAVLILPKFMMDALRSLRLRRKLLTTGEYGIDLDDLSSA